MRHLLIPIALFLSPIVMAQQKHGQDKISSPPSQLVLQGLVNKQHLHYQNCYQNVTTHALLRRRSHVRIVLGRPLNSKKMPP